MQAEVGGALGCATLQALMFKDMHCTITVAPMPLQCQRPNKPLFRLSEVAPSCELGECETSGGSCLVLGFWDQAEGSEAGFVRRDV